MLWLLLISWQFLTATRSARAAGEITVSVMVYRDMNINGVFDTEDYIMGGVRGEIEGISEYTSGFKIENKSNRAGFINFTMSATAAADELIISRPGHYRARVYVPDGMYATSDPVQTFEVVRADSRPGLIIINDDPDIPMFRSVGLIPASGGIPVIMSNHQLNSAKTITVPAPDTPCPGAAWVSDSGVDSAQSPGIADFDQFTSGLELQKVPNGYLNLGWDNITAMHIKMIAGPGYQNTLMSGRAIAYTSSGHPGIISRAPSKLGPHPNFNFTGGYFGAAWDDQNMIVRAYRDGELVYEDRLPLSTFYPVYFDANYQLIDRLEFIGENYGQIVMDNLVF